MKTWFPSQVVGVLYHNSRIRRYIIFFLALIPNFAHAQPPAINFQKESQLLIDVVSKHHFKSPTIDDEWSNAVFTNLIDKLDPDKYYFNAEQVSILSKAANTIDDDCKGKGWRFLPLLLREYQVASDRAIATIEKIYGESFDFNKKEFLSFDTAWALNNDQLYSRWRAMIKRDILQRYSEIFHSKGSKNSTTFLIDNEKDARSRSKKIVLRSALRMKNHPAGLVNSIGLFYLKSMAEAFDPHTAYLSETEIQNFLSSMSSTGLNFGFVLTENEDGEVSIEQLTPGGAAWNTGVLNSGDVIRELQWEGRISTDVTGMSVEEVREILEQENNLPLTITVMKPGGLVQIVSLKKSMLDNNENIVKSFILTGQSKIGFISLPGFYTSWGNGGSQCANDVATEIIKLKKEGIEGLILDLRYNGGGSLAEAVALAGIFIDAGPIGVVQDRNGIIQSVKDVNRGTIYDGPLVVMVNAFSASASEFVAAALSDYRRAIVVGSTTFGKATAQAIFPLKPNTTAYTTESNLVQGSHASITMEKIYRVNGKTAQGHGVTPIVRIPEVYDSISISEKNLSGFLTPDTIVKKIYYSPLILLPTAELREKSHDRVNQSQAFKTIFSLQSFLKQIYSTDQPVPADWVSFRQYADRHRSALNSFASLPESSRFDVTFHSFETERMRGDNYIDEYNQGWVKKIKKDISLEECFNIICDYITIIKRQPK